MAKCVAYNTRREEIASSEFEWNIAEFGEKIETAKTGESVKLEDVNVGETKWILKIFPNGENDQSKKGNIAFFCYSQNEATKTARVTVDLMDTAKNSTQAKSQRKVHTRGIDTFTYRGESKLPNTTMGRGFGFDNVKLPANGHLILFIKIEVLGEEKTTRNTHYDFQEISSIETQEKLKAIELFKDGWMNKDFSDVEIKCKGEIFYCHRMILAKRSPYFRGMLESGLEESQTQLIDLDHMDVDVLKAILKFIYGGEIGNLEINAVLLLEASNMFILEDLKDICEKYLLANYMKSENVIDVLVMADAHNANHLKRGAMKMIVTNIDVIVKQVGWKEKLVDKPKILLEILEATSSASKNDMDS